MRRICYLVWLFALFVPMPRAQAQVAQDAEEAQQFLIPLLEQVDSVRFMIGNDISDRGGWGLRAIVQGSSTSYRKKFFGGWERVNSSQEPYRLGFKHASFGRVGADGKYDSCTTSVGKVEVVSADNLEARFRFPEHGRSQEAFFGDDVRWVYEIEQDPQQFAGPYRIDWRKATLERSKQLRYGWTDFLIKTDQKLPYAQVSVAGEDLADYVENAIRVLQLSCRG
jgi:hypothetical protein